MDNQNMSVFDRILVKINNHDLDARPIEFVTDPDDNPVEATAYETTCPVCGDLVQFKLSEVKKKDDRYLIGCPPSCGRFPLKNDEPPKNVPEKVEDKIEVAKEGQIVYKPEPIVINTEYPFCDPVQIGVFDPAKL